MIGSTVRRGIIVAALGLCVAASASALSTPIDGPATLHGKAVRIKLAAPTDPTGTHRFNIVPVTTFDRAWAMSFVPNTNTALVTQKPGQLVLFNFDDNSKTNVDGVPNVKFAGQGGLGDVLVAPGGTSTRRTVYLSWVEAGAADTSGAAVGRATLDTSQTANPQLSNLVVLWRQTPKVKGNGHFSHRLALSPDGRSLFIASGDRQKMTPAQDPNSDLGKIIRYDLATGMAQRWTLGHRNPLGLVFAPDGRLWSSEMGPAGGDELNLVIRHSNYGWPRASNGSHYDGRNIPDHTAGDGFRAPVAWWNPAISPGALMIYDGDAFPSWRGDAFLGALSGEALVRVDIDAATGTSGQQAERWDLGTRIRVVTQDPRDGSIWLIEDGSDGRLLHLTPQP